MKNRVSIMLFAGFVVVAASHVAAQMKPARVSGQVYRSDSGKGFADVDVSLVRQEEGVDESNQKKVTTRTDAKGNYSFTEVAPGRYRVSVTAMFDEPEQHPCGPRGGLAWTKDGYLSSGASLSGILCVGHNMRSVHAPETEIVHV